MKVEDAKKIVKCATRMGLDVELYEEYSGRFMFGKTTTGVTGDKADIAAAANEAGVPHGGFSWDGMGKSDVIAY